VNYEGPLREAVFVQRRKRFFCDVLLDGEPLTAHLANTGSMRGCTAPDAPVRVRDSGNPKRKLRFSAEQIRVDGEWIVVNTARANQVVGEALERGLIEELHPYEHVLREVKVGDRRLDFALKGTGGAMTWVEVKSVTLREGRGLRFPDAVSQRATHHAHTLAELARGGDRAVMLFLVPREGGDHVRLADDIDPTYADAVHAAVAAGVEVVARRAWPRLDGIELGDPLPVQL
jgi:sugar fermentation stimulation protein A